MRGLHPYLDWPGPLAFAHRGGTSDHPENTMPAFQHAIDLGYTYLETDVHSTSDGVLVAFHDPELSRTCSRPGLISDLSWRDVSTARVHGLEPIPRFEDLMQAFPNARVNIDCKASSAVEPLVKSLRRLDCLDRVCVGSFSDRRLRTLRRELGPQLCTSLGPVETAMLRFGLPSIGTGRVAQVPVSMGRITVVNESTVERAHDRGMQVHVWTIDEADEMRRLLDLGVDGLMTDVPSVLRDVLTQRGQWHGL